ncbi:MAG: hypothetical protein AAB864_01940 [Patescibacteria group bacterium]|mgnify:CR=1 FL=1
MASYGNRTTDNAPTADSGRNLIAKAVSDIEKTTEWRVTDRAKFAGSEGIYYDSKKVGSYFIAVTNSAKAKGVLKLQLRPIAFGEGSIIRHIAPQLRTQKIRLPKIYLDTSWNEKDGYGFLIFEDLSHLPKIWSSLPPVAERDYRWHKEFIKEFLHNVLPVTPFVEKPTQTPLELARESFEHYWNIAKNSAHKHIDQSEIQSFKEQYFRVLEKVKFEDLHFTHGHLTGLDILWDQDKQQFVLLGNLYWKWRSRYWELTFSVWNSIMHVRDKSFSFNDFMGMVNRWNHLWSSELYDHDPTTNQQYWINLLGMAMNTIMLDLGSSEWKEGEQEERQALLETWKRFFNWLIENKFQK